MKSNYYVGFDLGFGDDQTHIDIWEKKQKKWIGKNNLWGRLRYWYYKRRGWVQGDYYFVHREGWKIP